MTTTSHSSKSFTKIQQDMNQLFETHLNKNKTSAHSKTMWIPSVDIKEDDRQFILYADVPGVTAQDIEIVMENGVLIVKGERSSRLNEQEGLHRQERLMGYFERRFVMPSSADETKISAQVRHGVLQIIIIKSERAKPCRIDVKS